METIQQRTQHIALFVNMANKAEKYKMSSEISKGLLQNRGCRKEIKSCEKR
jgi:hypothetical protein